MKKTPADLITEDWLEETMKNIEWSLPSNMDGPTKVQNRRRLLRAHILERLNEA